MLSGKKTKNIKVKFFFIKDRVESREIKVMDCPTEDMWADVLTKPLQGMAFQTMQAELIYSPVNYEDPPEEITKQARKKMKQILREPNTPTSPKLVIWKGKIASPFKAPQECVGCSGITTQGRGQTDASREPHILKDMSDWRIDIQCGTNNEEENRRAKALTLIC
jgi:hypothetical protein